MGFIPFFSQKINAEALLLVFLLIRPTLDYWRDAVILDAFGYALTLTAALSFALTLWSAAIMTRHRRALKNIPAFLPGAGLFLLMAASAAWSIAPGNTIIETIKWFNALSLFAIAYIGVEKKMFTRHELARTICASAAIPILVGIYQLISGSGMSTFDIHGRVYGTLAHPNVFAFLLLSIIFILTAGNHRVHRPLSIVVLTVLMLFTYTRAAFVGLAVYAIALGLLQYRKTLLRATVGIAVAVLVLVPLNAFLADRFDAHLERAPIISRIATRNEDADSWEWRQSLARETMPIIRARMIFGYGFGAFERVWSDNRGERHLWDDSAEAHNDYLRIALELGLVGLALYVWFLLMLAWKILQPTHYSLLTTHYNLAAWIITFIVVSFSDNMLNHTPVLWLTFAWWGARLASSSHSLRVSRKFV